MVHWLLQVSKGDSEVQEVGQIVKHWGNFEPWLMVHWLLQVFEGDNEAQEVGQILKHWGGFREVCGQANDFTLHCESNRNLKQGLEHSITKKTIIVHRRIKEHHTVHWERFQENQKFWADCGATVFIYARRLKRMLFFFVLLSKAVCRYLGVSHLFQMTN